MTQAHNGHSPERQLWASVLALGLTDATGHIGGSPTGPKNAATRKTIHQQALSWLNTRDFHEVCQLAGFDPDAIKAKWEAGKITQDRMRKAEGRDKK